MAEPLKHAPGVVCIIQIRTSMTRPTDNALRSRALVNGRTCTIVGPAPTHCYDTNGERFATCRYPAGKVAWLVEANPPLTVSTNGPSGSMLRLAHQRTFLQVNLIPIAGPGIDVDETATIETPVPTQSPVPATT